MRFPARAMRLLVAAILAAMAVLACGCTSVQSHAVATGALRLPPRAGPVAVYAATRPPVATELGVVEVRAVYEEGNVDALLQLFLQRVAELGGNAAVIESVRGRLVVVARPILETFAYQCGFRYTCTSTRMVPANEEVLFVTMSGRAMQVPEGARVP